MQSPEPVARFAWLERGVKEGSRHSARLQPINLVFHQRNQRRDDHRQTASCQRWQLETKGFAAPGWQQSKDILSGEYITDDLLLQRPEGNEPEILLQQWQELRAVR